MAALHAAQHACDATAPVDFVEVGPHALSVAVDVGLLRHHSLQAGGQALPDEVGSEAEVLRVSVMALRGVHEVKGLEQGVDQELEFVQVGPRGVRAGVSLAIEEHGGREGSLAFIEDSLLSVACQRGADPGAGGGAPVVFVVVDGDVVLFQLFGRFQVLDPGVQGLDLGRNRLGQL